MPKGDHLGEFEHLVMLALLRLKDDAYGLRVRREIQSRTERAVTIGSVYATHDRLEQKGYVLASVSGPTGPKKGRARKYFHITPRGAQALMRKQDAIQRMTEGMSLHRELEAI
jgi:DNA-binding PadR family transcriptional regulator